MLFALELVGKRSGRTSAVAAAKLLVDAEVRGNLADFKDIC